MFVEAMAGRAVGPPWETHNRNVVTVLSRRRQYESAHMEDALQARLMQVRQVDRPAIQTCNHE